MRSLTGTGLVVAALAATVAALLFPVWSYRDRVGTGAVDLTARSMATRYGPLSPLDRDFIDRVRLAGLWELPAGQQAQERGTTAAVRRAGEHLVTGHTTLDNHVRQVADQLGLDLPNQPNAQQRGWLTRLGAARGGAYDRAFANILRLAHGKVFTVVAQVRATSRNALVRSLADDANATVLDHIGVLEDTGLVDFDAIAEQTLTSAPPPTTRPTRARTPSEPTTSGTTSPSAPTTSGTTSHTVPTTSDTPSPSATYSLPPAATRPERSPEEK
ncbi:DUF4142 domain-containing protein [Streptomyces varsoviensis]|uniref:DUF4142 domain-containing protein n=1 Tax=Streptomyces varsoviensis TaxID=67373 RepID=UPI0033C70790